MELPDRYRNDPDAVGEILIPTAAGERIPLARLAHVARNFDFFGAPAALFCFVDRQMGAPQWSDLGMFLENIMVAARARGLDTCPQAAFNAYHALISEHLGLDAEREMVVVGMALGHADPQAIENSLLSERVPVSDFATFWP